MGAAASSVHKMNANKSSHMSRSMSRHLEIGQSRAIDGELAKNRVDNAGLLMVLGTGNSGKSTILKQLSFLSASQNGENNFQKLAIETAELRIQLHRNIIRGCLDGIRTIIDQSYHSGYLTDTILLLGTPHDAAQLAHDLLFEATSLDDVCEVNEDVLHIKDLCKSFWKDTCDLFEKGNLKTEVQLAYLLEDSVFDRLNKPDYKASHDDWLQVRARTSGVIERLFCIDGNYLRVVDVGGQKNERRKWIHHFDKAVAVLFMVSLGEINESLLEDSRINNFLDARDCFREICECPFLTKSMFTIIFNKMDLFDTQVVNDSRTTSTLQRVFPEEEAGLSSIHGDSTAIRKLISEKFVKVFHDSRVSDYEPPVIFTCATDTSTVTTILKQCIIHMQTAALKENAFM